MPPIAITTRRPRDRHRTTLTRRRAAAGGATSGAGVAAMHYIGMAAVEVPGRIAWSADLVVASVLLGMVLGSRGIADRDARARTARTTLLGRAAC